jgi:hypothetical protein
MFRDNPLRARTGLSNYEERAHRRRMHDRILSHANRFARLIASFICEEQIWRLVRPLGRDSKWESDNVATTPSESRLSNLVGRDGAAQHLCDLLSAYRVVTLTGPGGIGTTRLAMEVARRVFSHFQSDCLLWNWRRYPMLGCYRLPWRECWA